MCRIYLRAVLFTMIICICNLKTDASELTPSFILLNNNSILEGEVVAFKQGYLYFSHIDKVLKISPSDLKGIFRSYSAAENMIIILDELPSSGQSSDLAETFTLIYAKAEKIILSETPYDCVLEMITELKNRVHSVKIILNINIYKQLLTLSAVAGHYNLGETFSDFFTELSNKSDMYNSTPEADSRVKFRIKAIEYLIQHPYIYKGKNND